jgi:hypothetical protein
MVLSQGSQLNGQFGALAHVVEHGIYRSLGCDLVRCVDDEKQLLVRRTSRPITQIENVQSLAGTAVD